MEPEIDPELRDLLAYFVRRAAVRMIRFEDGRRRKAFGRQKFADRPAIVRQRLG
jgi:hypothetical protein